MDHVSFWLSSLDCELITPDYKTRKEDIVSYCEYVQQVVISVFCILGGRVGCLYRCGFKSSSLLASKPVQVSSFYMKEKVASISCLSGGHICMSFGGRCMYTHPFPFFLLCCLGASPTFLNHTHLVSHRNMRWWLPWILHDIPYHES